MNEEKITRDNIGARLKAARMKGKITWAKVREITGLSIKTIYNVETGKHPKVSVGTIKLLADFIKAVENGEDFRG